MWGRILASPFLSTAHSPPLPSDLDMARESKLSRTRLGQKRQHSSSQYQLVPVCGMGLHWELGTVPHLTPLPLLLSVTLTSGYSRWEA